MKNTFFTSDLHFNHVNIAGPKVSSWPKGYRNFDTVAEMNECIIANWNNLVQPDDIVHIVGDVALGKAIDLKPILLRLNGHLHLYKGNHEKAAMQCADQFASIQDIMMLYVDKQPIWLSHYAHRTWPEQHALPPSWHLYGHSHGTLPDDSKSLSFDVGMDCHDFKPLSFDDVRRIMNKKDYAHTNKY
jgi:hypothetical protein